VAGRQRPKSHHPSLPGYTAFHGNKYTNKSILFVYKSQNEESFLVPMSMKKVFLRKMKLTGEF
jgi:hypothetical protein